MGGGVNPIEWVLPPLAMSHLLVDQGAKLAGQKLPPVPGSPDAKADDEADAAEAARIKAQDTLTAQGQQAERDLAARTETPQEALDARRRAVAASVALGGGKRRASQTLTTPGMTLSGSYP